jgi:hypothetical protein
VTAKSRVVTFRLDEATWDFMRKLVPYTRYRNASSFIREGIDLVLKREEEQPSGWTIGRCEGGDGSCTGVSSDGRPGQTSPSGLCRPSARRKDRREG